MSTKRVQFAQSLPALTSAPAQESGRVIFYAMADGVYYRTAAGAEVGPLGSGGATAANIVTSATFTANKLTVTTAGALPTSPTTGDLVVLSDIAGSGSVAALTVQDEGVTVPDVTALNFVGPGLTVTPAVAGVSTLVLGETGVTNAEALGYTAFTHDVLQQNSSVAPTSGRLHVMRIDIPRTITVTNLECGVFTAGSGLNAGANMLALYTSAGNLIGATADLATAFGSAGRVTAPLVGGPYTITGGPGVFIWAALKSAGTTPPVIIRQASPMTALTNGLRTASQFRIASIASDATLPVPASFVVTNLAATNSRFWMALT